MPILHWTTVPPANILEYIPKCEGKPMFQRVIVSAAASILLAGGAAQAAIIDVAWSGTVIETGVAGTVDVGDTITGYYSFDDTAPISSNGFSYSTNHDSFFFVNGLSGKTSHNEIAVFNNGNLGDQIDSRSYNNAYTGDLIDGHTVSQVFVRFNDSSASVFSSTVLPSSLDPSDFDFIELSRLDGPEVYFRVTDFTYGPAAAVPLPAALPLFLSGLVGLGVVGWRRHRQKSDH
jgi:hypothetical protein